MTAPKKSFTVPEAAEQTGQSEKAILTAIRAGHLRAKRGSRNKDGIGVGKFLILERELDTYLDGLPDA